MSHGRFSDVYDPPERDVPSPSELAGYASPTGLTFREFAARWYDDHEGQWRENTALDYTWQIQKHLLPFFGEHRLPEITVREIDRYKQAKIEANQLAGVTINKTLMRLGQILQAARELGLIESNPAAARESGRLSASRPRPSWLERVEVEALLDAAGELDREARSDRTHIFRRAIVAVLVFTGIHTGELLTLRWRHVDLKAGVMRIEGDLPRVIRLHDRLLVECGALSAPRGPRDLVFPTSGKRPHSASNVRQRVIGRAARRAGMAAPTPRDLRNTFALQQSALGIHPRLVADELGTSVVAIERLIQRARDHSHDSPLVREFLGLVET